MRHIARSAVVGAAVVVTLLAFGAVASAQGPNKCLAGKNKCASKKMQSKLKCHNKAEKDGVAIDPICLQKATDKFDGGTKGFAGSCFGKLEIKNDLCTGGANDGEHCEVNSECPGGTCTHVCLTSGDLTTIENKVDAFVTDVVSELDPSFPTPIQNDCSAAKKKCVLKKAAALLKCHEKAVKDGTPIDAVCLQKAKDKFDGGTAPAKGCFAKLEAKVPPSCITTSDTGALEIKVDAFVQDVLCELGYTTLGCGPPTPTPTPTLSATPTPTVTATPIPGFNGALTATAGRFNYNLMVGLPAANNACNSNFIGSHACTYAELQTAEAAGDLVGLKDIGNNTVTAFWAIDSSQPPLQQCQDDVTSFLNWEYGTAHTASRGQKVTLTNPTGVLGPLQSSLQCNFSTAWVGCCV